MLISNFSPLAALNSQTPNILPAQSTAAKPDIQKVNNMVRKLNFTS